MSTYTATQNQTWDGLCLAQPINIEKRLLIKKYKASLLDFRNYLFSRQCTLLFMSLKPKEVGERAIPFIHNCIQELDRLEVSLWPYMLYYTTCKLLQEIRTKLNSKCLNLEGIFIVQVHFQIFNSPNG